MPAKRRKTKRKGTCGVESAARTLGRLGGLATARKRRAKRRRR